MQRQRLAALLLPVIFVTVTCISAIGADEIVMKSGERFSSDHIWEDNGKIRFDMQGLMVNVNKEDVTAIVRDGGAGMEKSKPAAANRSLSLRTGDTGPSLPLTPRGSAHGAPGGSVAPGDRPGVYPHDRSFNNHSRPVGGTGLENISWRMDPDSIDGLVRIKPDPAFGGIDQYWRPDHPLAFGKAPLDGLVYGFWQNQLYTIVMWVDGTIGFRRLKEAVFDLYGPVSQNRSEMERYIWLERETQRMLEFDPDLNTGLFVIRSAELDALIKKRFPPDK